MEKFWLIGVPLFMAITFLVWKLTIATHRKLVSEKESKLLGSKIYYWEFVIMISSALTILIIFLLKWGNILS